VKGGSCPSRKPAGKSFPLRGSRLDREGVPYPPRIVFEIPGLTVRDSGSHACITGPPPARFARDLSYQLKTPPSRFPTAGILAFLRVFKFRDATMLPFLRERGARLNSRGLAAQPLPPGVLESRTIQGSSLTVWLSPSTFRRPTSTLGLLPIMDRLFRLSSYHQGWGSN